MNVGSFICAMMVVAQVLGSIFGFGSVSVSDLLTVKAVQAAEGINKTIAYQGKLMNKTGSLVADGNYQIKFSLYDSASGGNRLWTASSTNGLPTGTPASISVSVTAGLFSLALGDISSEQIPFPDDIFNNNALYLAVAVGSDSEMSPRKRVGAVPYAYNADALHGQHASGSSLGADATLFALTQASSSSAYTTRTALYIETKGTNDLLDFLLRANNSTNDVFTVSRQGHTTTTGNFEIGGTSIIGNATTVKALFNSYVQSDFVPYTNNTYQMGSSDYRWKMLNSVNVSSTNVDALGYVSTTYLYFNGNLFPNHYFKQLGNTTIVPAVLGTNDNFNLSFEVNNAVWNVLNNAGQFGLAGAFNVGVNASGYKLLINNYSTSSELDPVYPIYVEDEDDQVDFYIRSATTTGGNSSGLLQGDVQIGSAANNYLTITGLQDAGIYLHADSDSSSASENPYIYFTQDGNLIWSVVGLTGTDGFDPRNVAYTGALANAFLIGHRHTTYLQFGTNNNARMTMDGSGNTGIGTTAPQFPLAVSKTSTNKDVMLIQASSTEGAGSSASIAYKTDSGNGTDSIQARITAVEQSDYNADLLFEVSGDSTQNTSTAEAMRIRYNGNVGIGDSSPASLFTVGSGGLFQVDANGDIIKIRNVTSSWPILQAGAVRYLKNNGSGQYSWAVWTISDIWNWQEVTEAGDTTTNWIRFFGASSTGNLNPSAHNTYDLGLPNYAWRNIYVSSTGYFNNLIADQFTVINVSGTNLDVSGYVSTTDLFSYSAEITNVTTTNIYNSGTVSTTQLYVNGTQVTGIEAQDLQDVTDNGAITTNKIQFAGATTTNHILPDLSLSYDLGASTNRWKDLWAKNIYLGTSTSRLQQETNGSLIMEILDYNYDEFNNNSIESYWTTSTPSGTITESGEVLNISCVGTCDWYSAALEASPIIYQPLTAGDFTVTTKIASITAGANSNAGITLYTNRNNAINWVKSPTGIYAWRILNDSAASIAGVSVSVTNVPLWLRIKRVGTTLYFDYSINGIDYITVGTYVQPFTPTDVGVFGKTWSGSSISVNYEFFDLVESKSQANISSIGNLLPGIHNIQDIGAESQAWKNLFVSNINAKTYNPVPNANVMRIVSSTNLGSTGIPLGMVTEGNYAYVGEVDNGTFKIINIAESSSTSIVGSLDTGYDQIGKIIVNGDLAYVNVGNRFIIINVRDKENPAIVGTSPVLTPSNPSYDLYVSGGYVYFPDSANNEVDVLNAEDPTDIYLVDSVAVTDAYAITGFGSYVYTISQDTANQPLSVINISDPLNPSLVGSFNTGLSADDYPISIQAFGADLYIRSEDSHVAVDISNPSSPTVSDSISIDTGSLQSPQSLTATNDYIYTLSSDSLIVVDVSDSNNTSVIAEKYIAANLKSLDMQGKYAYIMDSSRNLHIVDLGGIETHALLAHSARLGNVSANGLVNFDEDANILGDLMVGTNGIYNTGKLNVLRYANFYSTSTFLSDIKVNGRVNSDLLPYSTLTYDLGSSDYRWRDLWASSTRIGTSTWDLWQSNTGFTISKNNLADIYLNISNAGHLLPGTHNTQDIGIATNAWRNIYASGTAYLGGVNFSGGFTQGYAQNVVLTTYGPVALGGTGYDIAIQGRYAYVNRSAYYLQIYDIINPTAPVLVSQIQYSPTNSYINHLEVQGDFVYAIGRNANKLFIIDVSDPANPYFRGSLTSWNSSIRDIKVRGKYAYVAEIAGTGGLNIIDISDPDNPVRIKRLTMTPTNRNFNHLYLDGNYAYMVTDDSYFCIVDISDPYNPVQKYYSNTNISAPDEIIVQGEYAYMLNAATLRIYNVASSTNPFLVKSVAFTYTAGSLRVADGYAYIGAGSGRYVIINVKDPVNAYLVTQQQIPSVGDSFNALEISGNHAYVLGASSLRILNLKGTEFTSVAGNSAEMGFLNVLTDGNIHNDLTVVGGLGVGSGGFYTNGSLTAYATSSFIGRIGIGTLTPDAFKLQVAGNVGPHANVSYDLGSSANKWRNLYSEQVTALPTSLELITATTTIGEVNSIKVQGRYTYTLESTSTLRVYEMQNPAYPTLVSSLYIDDGQSKMVVQGNFAYIAGGDNAGVSVVDISNPGTPVLRQTFTTGVPTDAKGMYISGKYLFVAYGGATDSVYVYNVSDPDNIDIVSDFGAFAGDVISVSVQGNFAYITEAGNDDLHIYDITGITNPVSTGTVALGVLDPTALAVKESYAYTADADDIRIIDISSSTSPTVLTSISAENNQSLFIADNYLYAGGASLYVIDVSSSTNPEIIETISSVATINDLDVSGRNLYAGLSGTGQIRIYDVKGAYVNGLAANIAAFGNLQVLTDVRINNTLDVGGALTIGNRGIYTNGNLSVLATSTLLGRVGIGTANPNNFQLQIVGSIGPDANDSYDLASTSTRFQNATLTDTLDINHMNTTYSGGYNIGATNPVYAVAISKDKAYIGTLNDTVTGNNEDFQIYDVSDPVSPVYLAGINVGATYPVSAVTIAGRYAYIGTRDASTGNEDLQIYDIADSSSPVRVGGFDIGSNVVNSIVVSGKYAYVGSLNGTHDIDFFIFDVSNPANITLVDGLDVGANPVTAIKVQNRYAYIGTLNATTGNEEFQIYDISNPYTLTRVGGVDVGTSAINDLQVVGKYAYIATVNAATNDEELQIYNIANPASITRIGGVSLGTNPVLTLHVAGNYLYLGTLDGTSDHDLFVYDITNPASPALVDSLDVSTNTIRDLASDGRHIYITTLNSAINSNNEDLQIFAVGGLRTPNAYLGSLQIDDLSVRGNGYFDNNLMIRNSLNIGTGGIYSNGNVSVLATTTLSDIAISGRVNSDWLPYFDNTYDLGNATYRWRNLQAVNGYLVNLNVDTATDTNIFVQHGNSFGETAVLGTNDAQVLTFETNNVSRVSLDGTGTFYPATTNAYDIGTSTKRWADVWGVTYHVGPATWEMSQNVAQNFIISNSGVDYAKLDQTNKRNVFIGRESGNVNTGVFNAGFGYRALYSNVGGQSNSAFGNVAGYGNTSGEYNTAFGDGAISFNQTGSNNTAIGAYALQGQNTNSHSNNTAIGFQSMYFNTVGGYNTGIGVNSLYDNLGGASNTAVGIDSLYRNSTGLLNTGVGLQALRGNSSGRFNVAVGNAALYGSGAYDYNVAIGHGTLYTNNTGEHNVAIGTTALYSNLSGNDNLAIGGNALFANTSGYYNHAIGHYALADNTTGEYNLGIGFEAGRTNETGSHNVSYGYRAKTGVTGQSNGHNTALGALSQYSLTTGASNTSIGNQSLYANTTGYLNTAIGNLALSSNTTGYSNTALGNQALRYATSSNYAIAIGNQVALNNYASGIVAIGNYALANNNFALNNVGIGEYALYLNNAGNNNTVVGSYAGSRLESANNTAMGSYALSGSVDNASGRANTAIGSYVLTNISTGSTNTSVGIRSMYLNTSGSYNTAIGGEALYNNISGNSNMAIGMQALLNNQTGNYNLAIGSGALYANTTSSNLAIGYRSQFGNTTGSFNLSIGRNALSGNVSGDYNTMLGHEAGKGSSGQNHDLNTGLGALSLNAITTGRRNIALGGATLQLNTSGADNTAVGYISLGDNITGYNNTAVGAAAIRYNTTGNFNTGIGHSTLAGTIGSVFWYNSGLGTDALESLTTGASNTAVGYGALKETTTGHANIGIGLNALNGNITGYENIAIGKDAMMNSTSSIRNIAIGSSVLSENTSGAYNTGFGSFALLLNETGSYNFAAGGLSMYFSTSSNYNTAAGYGSLMSNNRGNGNVAFGYNASTNNKTGVYNVAVGSSAGNTGDDGGYSTMIGYEAGFKNQTGDYSTAIGALSLRENTSGMLNTAVGYQTLQNVTSTGFSTAVGGYALSTVRSYGTIMNTAFGYNTLREATDGTDNTALGLGSLQWLTIGNENSAGGYYAGNKNSGGDYNASFGGFAVYLNETGNLNTGVGYRALYGNSGSSHSVNTGIGSYALTSIQTGTSNTAVGYGSVNSLTTGNQNTAFGSSGLNELTTGTGNSALGFDAGYYTNAGNYNVAVGYRAFYGTSGNSSSYNTAIGVDALDATQSSASHNTAVGYGALPVVTTGDYNVGVGYNAGSGINTGYGNTFLGYSAQADGDYNNSMALGYLAVASSTDTVRIGNDNVASAYLGGSSGDTDLIYYGEILMLSDSRAKTDIVNSDLGLDFINLLRPVHFTMIDSGQRGDGLIAQEVESAALSLGKEFNGVFAPQNPDEYYTVAYLSFIGPLITSVQELYASSSPLFAGIDINPNFTSLGESFLSVDTDGNLAYKGATVKAQNIASSSTQAFGSYTFSFMGSAWNTETSQEITTSFRLQNNTISATSSEFNLVFATGTAFNQTLLTITDLGDVKTTGDLYVGKRLFLGSKATGGSSTSTYIFVDDTLGASSTYIATNADGWQADTSYDYAERYQSSDLLEPGDLVTADKEGINKVKRSTSSQDIILGIVSTKPGFITGGPAPDAYPIALAGRVPTKVSTLNGAIQVGDFLSPSDIPGVAVKSTGQGSVIGIALESYDLPQEGLISVFVNMDYMGNKFASNDSFESSSTDIKGFAFMQAGSQEVRVSHESVLAYPIIRLFPQGDFTGQCWTEQVTDTGFLIKFSEPQTAPMPISYIVTLPNVETVAVSDGISGLLDTLTGQVIFQQ